MSVFTDKNLCNGDFKEQQHGFYFTSFFFLFLFLPQDFLAPHLKLFSDRDFGNLGPNIDLTVPVINMDDTGYGMKTQSMDVTGGV